MKTSHWFLLFVVILLAVLAAFAIAGKIAAAYVQSETDSLGGTVGTVGTLASLFGKKK